MNNKAQYVLIDPGIIVDCIFFADGTMEIDYWFPGLTIDSFEVGSTAYLNGKHYRVLADNFRYRRVRLEKVCNQ